MPIGQYMKKGAPVACIRSISSAVAEASLRVMYLPPTSYTVLVGDVGLVGELVGDMGLHLA